MIDRIEALAKRLHLVDEPEGGTLSIGWDGLLDDTRERYRAYAKVALEPEDQTKGLS
jgi:hypothetical protein